MAVALAPQINDGEFLQFDKTLSSDAFGGRKPGTRGEVLTIRYLVDQFRHMHLMPGNHGYWLQSVPVVTTTLLNTGREARGPYGRRRAELCLRHRHDGFHPGCAPARRAEELARRIHGLRHRRAQMAVERLPGRERQGQDGDRAGQRPRLRHRRHAALQRQGDDLVRPLGLQVRGGGADGRRRLFIVHTSDDAAGYSWTVVRNSNGGPVRACPRASLRARGSRSRAG